MQKKYLSSLVHSSFLTLEPVKKSCHHSPALVIDLSDSWAGVRDRGKEGKLEMRQTLKYEGGGRCEDLRLKATRGDGSDGILRGQWWSVVCFCCFFLSDTHPIFYNLILK